MNATKAFTYNNAILEALLQTAALINVIFFESHKCVFVRGGGWKKP